MSASLFDYGSYTPNIFSIEIAPQQAWFDNLAAYKKMHRAIMIHGDSKIIGIKWPELAAQHGCRPQIDLLFIDGDHSYDGVQADIFAWILHVAPGGVVAFHDCACMTNDNPHESHYEVTRAVSMWQHSAEGNGFKPIEMIDSIIAYRRNNNDPA